MISGGRCRSCAKNLLKITHLQENKGSSNPENQHASENGKGGAQTSAMVIGVAKLKDFTMRFALGKLYVSQVACQFFGVGLIADGSRVGLVSLKQQVRLESPESVLIMEVGLCESIPETPE
jgi:hypothetical protein